MPSDTGRAGPVGADPVPAAPETDHGAAHRTPGYPRGPGGRHGHHGAQRRHRLCHQARHLIDGEPLIWRIVTLTGDAFKPSNAWCAWHAGTLAVAAFLNCKLEPDQPGHHMGAPMVGFALPPHAMVPVVRPPTCLLSPPTLSCRPRPPEQVPIPFAVPAPTPPPANLLPQELYCWYSQVRSMTRPRSSTCLTVSGAGLCLGLPERDPGAVLHKIAKDDIQVRAEHEKAERAKQRFEAEAGPAEAGRPRGKPATPRPLPSVARPRRPGDDPVAATPGPASKAKQGQPRQAVVNPDNAAMMAPARRKAGGHRPSCRQGGIRDRKPDDTRHRLSLPKAGWIPEGRHRRRLAPQARRRPLRPGWPGVETSRTQAEPPLGEPPIRSPPAEVDPKKAAIAAAIGQTQGQIRRQAQGDRPTWSQVNIA